MLVNENLAGAVQLYEREKVDVEGKNLYRLDGRYVINTDADFLYFNLRDASFALPGAVAMIVEFRGEMLVDASAKINHVRVDNFQKFDFKVIFSPVSDCCPVSDPSLPVYPKKREFSLSDPRFFGKKSACAHQDVEIVKVEDVEYVFSLASDALRYNVKSEFEKGNYKILKSGVSGFSVDPDYFHFSGMCFYNNYLYISSCNYEKYQSNAHTAGIYVLKFNPVDCELSYLYLYKFLDFKQYGGTVCHFKENFYMFAEESCSIYKLHEDAASQKFDVVSVFNLPPLDFSKHGIQGCAFVDSRYLIANVHEGENDSGLKIYELVTADSAFTLAKSIPASDLVLNAPDIENPVLASQGICIYDGRLYFATRGDPDSENYIVSYSLDSVLVN